MLRDVARLASLRAAAPILAGMDRGLKAFRKHDRARWRREESAF
jgi:hypothetical protein